MVRRPAKVSNAAAQRRHLRLYGNLDAFDDNRPATPAEQFLYLAAVHYRECRMYEANDVGANDAAKEMLKLMAVAVVWDRDQDTVIDKTKVKGLMKFYISLAKDDPPF